MKVYEIFENNVKHVNFGKLDGPRGEMHRVTMLQAFGSREENALADNGIRFTEKPDSWTELSKAPISEILLKKAEKIIGRIKEYSAKEVFGRDFITGPLVTVRTMPRESVVVIKFEDGRKYLVDTTQANTYIRMWVQISTGT